MRLHPATIALAAATSAVLVNQIGPEQERFFAAGMRDGADEDTPPLARGTSGPVRLRELLTGIGRRQ